MLVSILSDILMNLLCRVSRGCVCIFFFKQKTAYEMRISDWSSDVCSSDLGTRRCRAPNRRDCSISQGSWEDQDRGRSSCPRARSLPTRKSVCRGCEVQQGFQ